MTTDTGKRMGYEGIVKAASRDMGDERIEAALIAPGTDTDFWYVAVHFGCSPDEPHKGTSSMERCADAEEAERRFEEIVQQHQLTPDETGHSPRVA